MSSRILPVVIRFVPGSCILASGTSENTGDLATTMRLLILYNQAQSLKKGIAEDLACEQEIMVIIPLIVSLLQIRGYQVSTLKVDSQLWGNLKQIGHDVDLVFNLAEGFGDSNADETLVPAMLEALDVPFTGASSHNMQLTLDKECTKALLSTYGVPVAPHQIFRSANEVLRTDLTFPLIVKPVREEASIGIHADNVVTSLRTLQQKVEEILLRYGQPALVEKFINGREISVGIVGNAPHVHAFPPLEFLFKDARSPYERIRSYQYKWGGKKEQMVKARLAKDIRERLICYSTVAFEATECRDYARMDYRVDEAGQIVLLQVNYNPGIGPNTQGLNNTLTMMAAFDGITFEDLIERILLTAKARYRQAGTTC